MSLSANICSQTESCLSFEESCNYDSDDRSCVCVCVRLTWMANDDLMQQMSVANTSVEGKEQQEQQRRQ